jgi:hypothetical protein
MLANIYRNPDEDSSASTPSYKVVNFLKIEAFDREDLIGPSTRSMNLGDECARNSSGLLKVGSGFGLGI